MNEQQNHVFIDVENCGSSVGYYISINEYTSKDKSPTYSTASTVVLSDCNHKIDWYFTSDSVKKIDAAIDMLKEFRKKYVETEKLVATLNK